MKKTSNIFLSIIVLLTYLLCASYLSATDHILPNSNEHLSSNLLKKNNLTRLSDLPTKAREKVLRYLQQAEYEIKEHKRTLFLGKTSAYRAFNRNQNLKVYFNSQGVLLLPEDKSEPTWHLEMTLSGYGYDGAMMEVQPVRSNAIKALGHRLEYRRGILTEWYVNNERGLEQGVTFNAPPEGKSMGTLMVEWTVSGSLKPHLDQENTEIAFLKAGDQTVLRYSGLKAWDATGRSLSAKLAVRNDSSRNFQSRISYLIDATGATYPVMIDPLFTQAKKLLPNTESGDQFGISVSIDGDTAVVGAVGDDDKGDHSGSAYIFQRDQGGPNNWGLVKKITASDGAAWDSFGGSVSISSDTVVCAGGYDTGSAYIFDRNVGGSNNWGLVKKITASDGAESNFFDSVSISRDTLVAGASGSGSNTGSAYIFQRDQGGTNNWGQVAKITSSDGAAIDMFGYSVSISGETLVVGAFWYDGNGENSGSAYIFNRTEGGLNNWGLVKKITPSDGAAWDTFGTSVSISDDTLVIGAEGDDDNGDDAGSAYIFQRDQGGPNNWGQVAKITTSDGAANDLFGWSVSISGGTVVVGAWWDDDNGDDAGSAYIFQRDQGGPNNWGQVAKITASDGAANDLFGDSVSISGETVVVGASEDDDNGAESGSAYVFISDTTDPGDPNSYPSKAMPWIPLLLLDD